MDNKLLHDATASTKAIIYQFYVALEKCFDLIEGEKVIVEKYGDITVTDKSQIEVKDYSENLTDSHKNLWATLSNWLQEGFDANIYKSLILLTTQKTGPQSLLKGWNDKKTNQKLTVLEKIMESSEKRKNISDENKTLDLMKSVLGDKNRNKLKLILEGFIILDTSPKSSEYFDILKDKFGKGVPLENRGAFINSLLGFVICPETTTTNKWEISFDNFTDQVSLLTEQFCKSTRIFPKKYSSSTISKQEYRDTSGHLFVKRIEDIEYHDAINDAISDYVRTQKTIMEELDKRGVNKLLYIAYENGIIDSFKPKYRKASRNTKAGNVIKDSQDFYDDITGEDSPAFGNYNDTPTFFKNGTIHEHANDGNNDLKWKLESKDNE